MHCFNLTSAYVNLNTINSTYTFEINSDSIKIAQTSNYLTITLKYSGFEKQFTREKYAEIICLIY